MLNDQLTKAEIDPFDRVYKHVTAKLEAEAATWNEPDRKWLETLVRTFQVEFQKWNHCADLRCYRLHWKDLQTPLMRLAAGAFLHVSYDLPRAMADDWPGAGAWHAGPTQLQGHIRYKDLEPIFEDSFQTNARRWDVVGIFVPTGYSPRPLARLITLWLLHMRDDAWLHAAILQSDPSRRTAREQAMARALCAAWEDVGLMFWDIFNLKMDPRTLRAPALSVLAALSTFYTDYGWVLTLALLALTIAQWRRRQSIQTSQEARRIVTIGSLISDYVRYAVRDPEGFDEYRLGRRAGALRRPPDGSAAT